MIVYLWSGLSGLLLIAQAGWGRPGATPGCLIALLVLTLLGTVFLVGLNPLNPPVVGTGLAIAWAVGAARPAGRPGTAAGIAGGILFLTVGTIDAALFRENRYEPWRDAIERARQEYRPVPLAGRLPAAPADGGVRIDPTAVYGSAFADGSTSPLPEGVSERHWSNLYSAHLGFATRFAGRPEFGFDRMAGLHGVEPASFPPLEPPPPLPQPLRNGTAPSSVGPAAGEPIARLRPWHGERGVDFARTAGSGLLIDRYGQSISADRFYGSVSLPDDLTRGPTGDGPFLFGFRPHGMTRAPGDPLRPEWVLRRIELIGLVTWDEPVAYPSESLPRMEGAAGRETRALTPFEAGALSRLSGDRWLIAEETGDRLRALGALPAAAACAECHGVEEGRLLGAFSYDFVRP